MDFQVIYPKEIAAMQQEKGALVVDLREWKEYQAAVSSVLAFSF